MPSSSLVRDITGPTGKLDPLRKMEVHILEDCFGHQHIVELPLLSDIEHDDLLKKEIADMEARTQAFIDRAERRGHKVEDHMKQKDCAECK